MDRQNAIFDESGHFLVYCTMLGIKVVNLVTNKVSRVLGRHENVRFLHATMFQASDIYYFTNELLLCGTERRVGSISNLALYA